MTCRTRRASRGIVAVALTLFCMSASAAEVEPKCGGVTNNPELAIKVCTRLIEYAGLEKSELAKAYYTRGLEWATQGNHDRALADFDVAVGLDHNLPSIYYNRALSLSEKGEHDRAIVDYDQAVRLNPRDPRARTGRAVEWTMKGDYKRALADYEEVIRLDPREMGGYFGRARVRFYAGDFMPAASDFIRAHQLDGSMYTALWLYLARKRADIPGENTIAQESGTSGAGEWPAPLVALYLDKTTPDAVQKAATHQNVTRQRDQRCEANFYVAHWHLLKGARGPAAQLLREAQLQCPTGFIEHEGAVAELRRLEQKP
ncbi:MAG TPA: tetratricopeptide repeat protein [Burkholderiales bacterium]|nr:tetratricopeptide repeat protein [Burkholderiales bacterium]